MLWIGANQRVSRGEMGLPDGGSLPVVDTPADFTKVRTIRAAMENHPGQYFQKKLPSYDEFYLLGGRTWRHVATLSNEKNGRVMQMFTDMPCLVLFCNGGRAPEVGKHGQIYQGFCAVCLESGFVPNAVNCAGYDSPVFRKGERLIAHTTYQFFTK
jgi:aldose 1-epimerase